MTSADLTGLPDKLAVAVAEIEEALKAAEARSHEARHLRNLRSALLPLAGRLAVAVAKAGPAGRVVALDLLAMDPVAGATVLQGDFQDPAAIAAVREAMAGPADLVLSDMAPNTTGHNATDHLRIIGLAEEALAFAVEVLAPGGAFVAKVFQGGSERDLLAALKRDFAQVRHMKPPASRKDSAELYVVATGFRGPGA